MTSRPTSMFIRNGVLTSVSDRNTVTTLSCAARFRSRLHRPAACKMESNPATSRNTAGKSTSTPASMREVETTRQGSPLFSRPRTTSNTARRWVGVMRVDRWKVSSWSPSRSYSRLALLRVLTMQSTWGSWVSASATASQLISFSISVWKVTRRKIVSSQVPSGHSSVAVWLGKNSANSGFSAGWVAVQRTAVAWKWPMSWAMAETQGRRYGMGSICASSKMMTLLARLWSFRHLEERLL